MYRTNNRRQWERQNKKCSHIFEFPLLYFIGICVPVHISNMLLCKCVCVAIVSVMRGSWKWEHFENAFPLIVISTMIQCIGRVINFAIQFQPTVWWADKLLTQPPPPPPFEAIISNKTIKISILVLLFLSLSHSQWHTNHQRPIRTPKKTKN